MKFITVRLNTVQVRSVPFSAAECTAVRCIAVHCSALLVKHCDVSSSICHGEKIMQRLLHWRNVFCKTILVCCTLRSWVYGISHIIEQSPRDWETTVCKCCSDSFPHTKFISLCLENSHKHTLMFRCYPIPGRRF